MTRSGTAPAGKADAPRTAPREERRRQLIEATIASVARHGLSGTTMQTVTREAGLSIGLVNFHFRSKEALFEAVLRHLAEEHRAAWRSALDRPGQPPEARLRAIVHAQFHPRICTRRKLAVWFAFFGEPAHRGAYRRLVREIDRERWEVVADLCREIDAQADCEGIAKALEGLFDGLWLNLLMYPGAFTRQSAESQALAFLSARLSGHFAPVESDPSRGA